MISDQIFSVPLALIVLLCSPLYGAQPQGNTCDCQNGGSCYENLGFLECFCSDGFYGDKCQHATLTTASPTASTVCIWHDECGNGACYNGVCECVSGYTGNRCQTVVDYCLYESDCNYSGRCYTGICICDPYYSGSKCENKPDCTWSSGECVNGYCSSNACVCDDGYTGIHCETWSGFCTYNWDCNYHGVCNDGVCSCDYRYSGDYCESGEGYDDVDANDYDYEYDSDSSGKSTYMHYVIGFIVVTLISIAICIIRMSMRNRYQDPTRSAGQAATMTTVQQNGASSSSPQNTSQQQFHYYPTWYEPFQGSRQPGPDGMSVPIVITPPQAAPSAPEQPPAYDSVTGQDIGDVANGIPPPPSYDAAIEMRDSDAAGSIPDLYSAPPSHPLLPTSPPHPLPPTSPPNQDESTV